MSEESNGTVIPITDATPLTALQGGRSIKFTPERMEQIKNLVERGMSREEIAETIGRRLGIPAVSIPAEQAADHFKMFPFISLDITMPNADTRRLLGWAPVHPGLIADLEADHYFTG